MNIKTTNTIGGLVGHVTHVYGVDEEDVRIEMRFGSLLGELTDNCEVCVLIVTDDERSLIASATGYLAQDAVRKIGAVFDEDYERILARREAEAG
jgi:hypothetical protein